MMNISQKQLRIGIFTDDFYPYSGGVGRSIQLQINELQKLGHQVTLFAPEPFLHPTPDTHVVAMPVWRIPRTPSYMNTLRFGKKLAKNIATSHTFDVVHSQNERGSMFLAARIARLQQIPHVHTFHSNYAGTHETNPVGAFINTMTYMRIAPLILRRIRSERPRTRIRAPQNLPHSEQSRLAKFDWKSVAELAELTDAFTSPAQFMIDNINNANYNVVKHAGHVVPNGIATEIYTQTARRRSADAPVRFISSGRLDPEKRVSAIIDAFAKLNKPDAELYILGTGEDEHALRQQARDVKTGKIVFTGYLDHRSRIATELADGDVFVLGSYHFDTQGMVLAEAAACGLPIILCDDRLHVGVDSTNALLTAPDADSISNAMLDLYNNPDKRARMSAASKALVPQLGADAMERAFVEVYRSAINNS